MFELRNHDKAHFKRSESFRFFSECIYGESPKKKNDSLRYAFILFDNQDD